MSVDASTLPDSPVDLKEIIVKQSDHVTHLREAHNKEKDILLEQISLLRAQLFGRKTEKIPLECGPRPLPLFDMPEPEGIEEVVEETHVPANTRKKRGRKPLPADLSHIVFLIPYCMCVWNFCEKYFNCD